MKNYQNSFQKVNIRFMMMKRIIFLGFAFLMTSFSFGQNINPTSLVIKVVNFENAKEVTGAKVIIDSIEDENASKYTIGYGAAEFTNIARLAKKMVKIRVEHPEYETKEETHYVAYDLPDIVIRLKKIIPHYRLKVSVIDNADKPISDVKVKFESNGETTSDITDSTGIAFFQEIPMAKNCLTITLSKPNEYQDAIICHCQPADSDSASVSKVLQRNHFPFTLRIVDSKGDPIPNVTFEFPDYHFFIDEGSDSLPTKPSFDEDGKTTFPLIRKGTHEIKIIAPSEFENSPMTSSIKVWERSDEFVFRKELKQEIKISGKVKETLGQNKESGIIDAKVKLLIDGKTADSMLTQNVEGDFSFIRPLHDFSNGYKFKLNIEKKTKPPTHFGDSYDSYDEHEGTFFITYIPDEKRKSEKIIQNVGKIFLVKDHKKIVLRNLRIPADNLKQDKIGVYFKLKNSDSRNENTSLFKASDNQPKKKRRGNIEITAPKEFDNFILKYKKKKGKCVQRIISKEEYEFRTKDEKGFEWKIKDDCKNE